MNEQYSCQDYVWWSVQVVTAHSIHRSMRERRGKRTLSSARFRMNCNINTPQSIPLVCCGIDELHDLFDKRGFQRLDSPVLVPADAYMQTSAKQLNAIIAHLASQLACVRTLGPMPWDQRLSYSWPAIHSQDTP